MAGFAKRDYIEMVGWLITFVMVILLSLLAAVIARKFSGRWNASKVDALSHGVAGANLRSLGSPNILAALAGFALVGLSVPLDSRTSAFATTIRFGELFVARFVARLAVLLQAISAGSVAVVVGCWLGFAALRASFRSDCVHEELYAAARLL